MNQQIPVNNLAIVGGVFGMLLGGLLLLEVVQPVRKQTDVAAAPSANVKREMRATPAKPPTAQNETDDKDTAVAAWEAFVNRVKSACDKYNADPVNRPGNGRPSNFVRFHGEDINKSDSLRYPFVGELIVYEVFHFGKVQVEDIRWHFGWKAGKWEYKDSTSQRIHTPGGPTDPAQLDDKPRPVADSLLQGEKKQLILKCLQ